jgi:long-chain acyl-CoA synthetase
VFNESTIGDAFTGSAGKHHNKALYHYFEDGWQTLTYGIFEKRVLSTASFLQHAGLQKGDRAAIISENRHEWCSAYLSVVIAGGIAVPIDARLGPSECRNLLYDSESKIVFLSRSVSETISTALGEHARDGLSMPVVINFDSPEYRRVITTEPGHLFPEVHAEDLASLIYTSGTTGTPKGVMISHRNFCTDAGAAIHAGLVTGEDNILSMLPLHHTYAFMCTFLLPLFMGAAITYPPSLKGPDLLSAINGRGVSVLVGVPQLLAMMYGGIMNKLISLPRPLSTLLIIAHRFSGVVRRSFDVNIGRLIFSSAHRAFGSRFRFFASGGARLDPEVMKGLEALGFTVLEGYGLTETSPIVAFNPLSKRKPGSAGKALPPAEIRIIEPSETGEGEIAVRGPMVMKGYYKNPSATADVIKEGWFLTGDIGTLDRDGYLYITGRSKEVIVLASGKNIYPEEIEQLYMTAPLIKEICVLGSDDERTSDALHAVIVPDIAYAQAHGISNIHEEIKWAVNDISTGLASYMRLKGFTVHKEPLPRTPLGKLRRFLMRDVVGRKPSAKKRGTIDTTAPGAHEIAGKVLEALQLYVTGEEQISGDDNLELDLGLDSLSKIELTAALERMFSLNLSDDFMSDIQTVQELIGKIDHLKKSDISTEKTMKIVWKDILMRDVSEKDLAFVSLEDPESRVCISRMLFAGMRLLFRGGFSLEARGREHIPENTNCIIAPNHASYLDGFAVMLSLDFAMFKGMHVLGLKKYFDNAVTGWLAKVAHVIPIDAASYLNKALQMSAYVLKHNRSLVVFPEGGRSLDGGLMEFKKGIGILAIEMGVPVVPAYIHGACEALPRGARLPRFRNISVTFGRPLLASDMDFTQKTDDIDEYQFFSNNLREKVRQLMNDS